MKDDEIIKTIENLNSSKEFEEFYRSKFRSKYYDQLLSRWLKLGGKKKKFEYLTKHSW